MSPSRGHNKLGDRRGVAAADGLGMSWGSLKGILADSKVRCQHSDRCATMMPRAIEDTVLPAHKPGLWVLALHPVTLLELSD